MSFVHGKNTKVFYDEFDFSSYFDQANIAANADTAETTTFGKNSKTFIPGLKDATLALEGFFDGSADAVDEEFNSILGGSGNLFSIYQNGDAFGNCGFATKALETAYGIVSTFDNAVRISMAAQSSEKAAERIESLHALGANADTDWEGSAIDNGASSADGGSAYIHVTAATGTIEVKLEHSSDNFAADITDLATFTPVTGATAERIEFTGTVKQYVRGYATIAGGETITFNLGFHRA